MYLALTHTTTIARQITSANIPQVASFGRSLTSYVVQPERAIICAQTTDNTNHQSPPCWKFCTWGDPSAQRTNWRKKWCIRREWGCRLIRQRVKTPAFDMYISHLTSTTVSQLGSSSVSIMTSFSCSFLPLFFVSFKDCDEALRQVYFLKAQKHLGT